MTRTTISNETITLDDERIALRIRLHYLRERDGDRAEIAAGEARLKELSQLIASRISRKL
jgi:hypothetical protein